MYKYTLLMAVLFTQLSAQLKYDIGDQISPDHQNMEFEYCYPSDSIDVQHALPENPPDTTFSFSKHENKIFILEMSASWWGPCLSAIPVGDELYEYWDQHDDRVEIIHILDDIGQPYSCAQWGNTGAWEDSNGNGVKDEDEIPKTIPPIIDDGSGYTIFEWFEDPGGDYPMIVFIDHTKTVFNILYAHSDAYLTIANLTIETMLNAMPEMSTSIDDNIYFIDNFKINQLYPNPFNPVLHINYDIPQAGVIQVEILDIGGSHIETLHSGFLQSGSQKISWNAASMPSGMYLVSLKSGDKSLSEKVVLLK